MDDVELIAAAVERLRILAGETTPGPWHTDGPWLHQRGKEETETGMVSAGPDRTPVLLGVPWHGDGRAVANLRLAAALGPQVAQRLTWLLEAAQQHAGGAPWARPLWVEIAVDIAGKVLGGPGPEVDRG